MCPAFECHAPGIDETRRANETGLALVRRLALAKARSVAERRPAAWVIGSDQAASLMQGEVEKQILGKPGSAENCARQLRACSGRRVDYLTAVAVIHHGTRSVFEFIDTTRVTFRALGAAEIERYVAREAPFDCAGGFKSEGLGISLCEAIETKDPSALIGLPLIRLSAVLREIGFELP